MPRLLPVSARPAPLRAARDADEDYGRSDEPDWRGIDWREHLRSAQIAGSTVNYVDYGPRDAAPVVLIHGLSGRWANWLENIPRLGLERRVIAPDLPGFGDSEMPADEISISNFARCVDALCEQLGLGEVDVVGNSMGGFVGTEMAIRMPERVDRLVLVSAAGISIVDLRRAPVLVGARIFGAVAAVTAARGAAMLKRPRLTHASLSFVFRHPTRMPRDLLWEQTAGSGKAGFVSAMEALLDYDFTDRLPEVKAPTLIVWGDNDMLVPTKDAWEFERLIPDSRAIIFRDTGHCAMLERPRTFNDEVLRFLAETGSAESHAADAPAAA